MKTKDNHTSVIKTQANQVKTGKQNSMFFVVAAIISILIAMISMGLLRYSYYVLYPPEGVEPDVIKVIAMTLLHITFTICMTCIYFFNQQMDKKKRHLRHYHQMKKKYLKLTKEHDTKSKPLNSLLKKYEHDREGVLLRGMKDLAVYLKDLDTGKAKALNLKVDRRFFIPNPFTVEHDWAFQQLKMLPFLSDSDDEYKDINQT